MKIIIAVHHLPPHYNGGAELRAFRTASALQGRGFQVQLVCVERIDFGPKQGLNWEDEIYEGLPVRRLYFNLENSGDQFRFEYDNPWIGRHLADYFAEQRPAVFHLIGGYLMTASALRAAKAQQIPTVVTLTDFWFLCPRIQMLRSDGKLSTLPIDPFTCARCLGEEQRRFRWPGRALPWLMNLYWQMQKRQGARISTRLQTLLSALNQVDVIISPSRFLQATFIEAGISAERIHYSRQGRDFPALDPGHLDKTPSDRLRVAYIGQIAEHKGVHVLVKALQLLPDVPLEVKIYGDTAPFPKYLARLKGLAGQDHRLSFEGSYPRQEVSRVLQQVDVIVVPSLWYENSPNVILEAFAHRTPVIVSDLGGMSELVQDDSNGLTFKPGDASALADKLRRLAFDRSLVDRLADGIGPVRSIAAEVDDLTNIYQSLASGRSWTATQSSLPVHLAR